jgi:hypothetical protein
MRIKTLLLGSAAAVAFAGGSAQAADLSVAEPVDYVRVCDAFGAGFWYIPGTDTCIAISGAVKFEVSFQDEHEVAPDIGDTTHTGTWEFVTSADIKVHAKSMTDWGPLTAFIALTSDSDNTQSQNVSGPTDVDNDRVVYLDEAYVSLGPILAGYTGSTFNSFGGYTDTDFQLADTDADQVQLSWAFNGFGLILAVEDPRDRWASLEENDLPDLVAAITMSAGGADFKVAALYADTVGNETVAVNGSVEFELGAVQLGAAAQWADGPPGSAGGLYISDGWSAVASAQIAVTSQSYVAFTYAFGDSDTAGERWDASATAAFSPADNVTLLADITTNQDEVWKFLMSIERTFGPDG